MSFARFSESLDADNPSGKPYTFRFAVDPGDSVTAAVVAVVDPTSTTIAGSPSVAISGTTLGLISPNLYGVTFHATGTGVAGDAYIRCRYTLASGNGDDVTYVLAVQQR